MWPTTTSLHAADGALWTADAGEVARDQTALKPAGGRPSQTRGFGLWPTLWPTALTNESGDGARRWQPASGPTALANVHGPAGGQGPGQRAAWPTRPSAGGQRPGQRLANGHGQRPGQRPWPTALANALRRGGRRSGRPGPTALANASAGGQRPWPTPWPTPPGRTVEGARTVANGLTNLAGRRQGTASGHGLDRGPSGCRPAVVGPAAWSCRPDSPSDWSRRYLTGGLVPIAGHASFGSAGVVPCEPRRSMPGAWPAQRRSAGIAVTTSLAPSGLEPWPDMRVRRPGV